MPLTRVSFAKLLVRCNSYEMLMPQKKIWWINFKYARRSYPDRIRPDEQLREWARTQLKM
ncbi:hypothetical protein QUB63_25770 [Microcoleus sp. ARI1-B5]|uniref:hypothetical protein n=1 Tax=unclassified Microcoleus TaxID=2642155 RepID=UPI002FD60754